MKILYFYQYFCTPKGSWSTRVYEMTKRWVAEGHEVTVVTSLYDKSDLKPSGFITHLTIEGIHVILINVKLSNKHGFLYRLYTFIVYLIMACFYALTRRFEVVICSSGPLTVGIPGLCAKWLRRKPLVLEVRDLWPEGAIQLKILKNRFLIWFSRRLERTLYHYADLIVALSPGQMNWIKDHYRVDNIISVPNASDNALVEAVNGDELHIPEQLKLKPWVIYAGTLGLIDDCQQILEMRKVLIGRNIHDIHVLFIGDGNEAHILKQRVQQEAISGVHFLGLKPKREVMRWLLEGLCMIFTVKDVPFLATASPNKLFDAFAAGLPTIQVTDGWIKNLFDQEQCGLNVPINDANAMADAVVLLSQNEELRQKLSSNAKRLAKFNYDRDILSGKMIEAVKKIV